MRLFTLSLIIVAIAACGIKKDIRTETKKANAELTARQMMQAGRYAAAAATYLQHAQQDQQYAAAYRLKAAAAYIDAAELTTAQAVLDATKIDPADTLLILRRQLLYARIAIKQDQPALALQHLQQPPETNTPASLLTIWYTLYADASMQRHHYLEAVRARIVLADYLHDDVAQRENVHALWQGIRTLSLSALEEQCSDARPRLAGWCELGVLYKTMRYDTQKLRYALDGWSGRYPGHRANQLIVPALLNESRKLTKKPEHIALLLPFDDQYLKASEAIRDGLIAARYQDQLPRPRISIYDTSTLDIQTIYQRLVDAGSDFIIGPLRKEKIKKLLQYADIKQLVLSLNRIDSDTVPDDIKLVQFALAPEDEIEQVAERAWLDGHILALVVTPDTRWGERIYSVFKSAWEKRGGKVLEHQYFAKGAQGYAMSIKRILNVDSSKLRINILQNVLGRKLKSNARIREDADFIFLAAGPDAARQLMPHLRFFSANIFPVYSVSNVYSGIIDANKDKDMNGLYFTDIPWVLDLRRALSLIQDRLNELWHIDQSRYRRFYAFGIDAYRLLPELGRLANEQDALFSGETGDLLLTEQGKIKRRLYWARFADGKPVLED